MTGGEAATGIDPALGARALDWLLLRLKKQRLVATDLVLVRDRPSLLAATPAAFTHGGQTWRFARVAGPLALRAALPDPDGGQDRAVLAVPEALKVPTDVLGRCHLHRVVELRAQDVVSALAGRFCDPLDDPALEAAVWELLPELARRAGRWTMGPAVQQRDVRAMVLSALLGRQGLVTGEGRIDRQDPGELLGRWVARPPADLRAGDLLRQALAEAHGLPGRWLGEALVGGFLPALVAGGAVVDSPAGQGWLPAQVQALLGELGRAHGLDDSRRALSRVARGAAAWLVQQDPEALATALGPAEAAWQRGRAQAVDFPLLRGALRVALHDLARDCAQGSPPDDAGVEGLRRNVWAGLHQPDLELVRNLARLARFVAEVPVQIPGDAPRDGAAWAQLGLRDVAWADRVARDLRRAAPSASADLRAPLSAVLDQALASRDALNARFAAFLRDRWTALAAATDPGGELALHQLSRALLAPLLRQVDRVFLVVLDGCDASTFVELAQGLPPHLGLALPTVEGDAFAGALLGRPALRAAWSLPPTVTSHARRALFAGEIPGNPALDDTEATAADATSDARAFDANQALAGLSRRLFLKGELRDGGAALCQALAARQHRLIAAVFNGVDDALASHETTALGPWTPAGLGEGFLDALSTAVDQGWTVVLTSDHGHTPFWSTDRKLSGPAQGQRFKRTPDADGAPGVVMEGAAIPGGPTLCLHRVGAFYGAQRRGFHGGVGLEEMVIPLALLGRVRDGSGRPAPPGWWSQRGGAVEPDSRVPALPVRPTAPADAATPYRQAVADDPRALGLLDALLRHHRLGLDQVAALTGIGVHRLPGFVGKLNGRFRGLELGEPLELEGEGGGASVRWVGRR